MISGTLFLNPAKPLTYSLLNRKYVLRLVTAFVFWSLLYALVNVVIIPMLNHESVNTVLFRSSVLFGEYHLWFLFMIAGLYIITPLLRNITTDKALAAYFLLLWLVFEIVLSFASLAPKFEEIKTLLEKADIHFVLGFSGYFVLGWYLSCTSIQKPYEYGIYGLGVVGVLLTFFLTRAFSLAGDKADGFFYNNFSPNVMLASVAIFVFFNQRVAKWKFSEKAKRIILRLSACSFGIYLIHVFSLKLLAALGLNTLSMIAPVSIPVISLLVFLISFGIILLLRKIPLFRKYLS
jgi:surface polysaccharide O-acyltransferase-like enzyme